MRKPPEPICWLSLCVEPGSCPTEPLRCPCGSETPRAEPGFVPVPALSGSLQAQAGSQMPTGKLLPWRGGGAGGLVSPLLCSLVPPDLHSVSVTNPRACSRLCPSPAGSDPTENLAPGNILQPGLFPKGKTFSRPCCTGNTCSSLGREQGLPENYTMGSEEEGINKGIPLFVDVCELLGGSSSCLHHPPSARSPGHSRQQLPPQVGMGGMEKREQLRALRDSTWESSSQQRFLCQAALQGWVYWSGRSQPSARVLQQLPGV